MAILLELSYGLLGEEGSSFHRPRTVNRNETKKWVIMHRWEGGCYDGITCGEMCEINWHKKYSRSGKKWNKEK